MTDHALQNPTLSPNPNTESCGCYIYMFKKSSRMGKEKIQHSKRALLIPNSHLSQPRMIQPRTHRRTLHLPLCRYRLSKTHRLCLMRTRARQRARIRAWDWHIFIRHLPRRSRDMLIKLADRWFEAILLYRWRSVLHTDRGRLQGKWFRLREGVVF